MNDFDRQNTELENDEHVQITHLDPLDTKQRGFPEKILNTLHNGFMTPWIRYSLISCLLLILVGALFLQTHQPAPASVSGPGQNGSRHTSLRNGTNMSFATDQAYIQASDGTLFAYQDENGRVLWRDVLPGQASLEAYGQTLFCYYATAEGTGMIVALDGKDGHVLWHYALPAPGTYLALDQEGDALYAADGKNTIYAFQASNGQLRWIYHSSDTSPASPIANLLQVQQGIAVIFALNNFSIILLRASDGQKILSTPAGSGREIQITVDGQLIYELPEVSGNSRPPIQVFQVSDGKQLWTLASALVNTAGSIEEQDGTVYLSSSGESDSSSLTALNGSNGHILWIYQPGSHNTILETNPDKDGTLSLLLNDYTLIYLRSSDAKVLWSIHLNETGQLSTLPYSFVDNGLLILIDISTAQANPSDNQIDGLSLNDGKMLWQITGYSELPFIQSGIIYLTQTNGRIDAWQESDGTQLWRYQASVDMSIYGNPAGNSNLVFLLDTSGNMVFLRIRDGKQLWRYQAQ